MPWVAPQAGTQLLNIQEEQFFAEQPELPDADSVVHCQVTLRFKPGGIGGAIVTAYGADGDFDTEPIDNLSFILSRRANPSRVSFTVSGVRRFRIGVQSSGTLGTLESADLSFTIGTTPLPPPG
jgi:hypothetical protein